MILEKEIDNLYNILDKNAKSAGYYLNPDIEFTKELVKGLLENADRYGYLACPCRLASGKKLDDIDIICPCDYRDEDLNEYGTCFCGLYVSKKVIDEKKEIEPIPERRPNNRKIIDKSFSKIENRYSISKPIWRCRVCGYLCGRDNPPEICPICKANRDRFERFLS
jgi:ferredoxin-thioredoxin reductase catalytic subunit